MPSSPSLPGAVVTDRRVVLGAAIAIAIGSLGPWATVSVFGLSVARNGTSGDGVMTLILAAVIAAAFFVPSSNARWLKRRGLVALIAAALTLAIAVYDFVDISSEEIASVGWGLYLTVLASFLAVVAVSKQRNGLSVDAGPDTAAIAPPSPAAEPVPPPPGPVSADAPASPEVP